MTNSGLTRTLLVLAALVAGLTLGAWLSATDSLALTTVEAFAGPIGTLWLNALRMTVVPLVFAMLFTGVVSAAETAATGGLAARALAWFIGLILASGVFSVVMSPLLLDFWPVSSQEAAALVSTSQGGAVPIPAAPPFGDWLLSFVPVNPIGAAAEGAMVPLVVFALIFGLAATRIAPAARAQLSGFLDAVVQAMLVIVEWVLWAAPIGIFGLATGVGAKLGSGAFGLLFHYISLLVTVQVLLILCVYPLAALLGRTGFGPFTRAVAPVQLVALSTQSSIACLPAMVEAATELDLPEATRRLVLPLAVSLFKITSPCANLAVVIYVASVHGIALGPLQFTAGVLVAVAVAVASAGLPGGTSFFLACVPLCAVMGVPTELLPLLLAVEVIPDILRTIGNVTGQVAITAVLSRNRGAVVAA
ncbi:dicarboxylate/amino acid:cation symporter [Glacieibacterium sp.]|uniref:dicarboxylate/amino acid:cation symporter n=1 Tax=Glacieibacterium sp. TaxID=2860237 RepID=UPI003B00678D